MKTMTFFSPKGGVGKTTLTFLFADYLKYRLGASVRVMDAEYPKHPIMHFRETDLAAADQPGAVLYNYFQTRQRPEPYPIQCVGRAINEYDSDDVRKFAWMVNKEIESNKYEYLLLDFPAGYSEKTPISCLIHNHLIDAVIVPMSTESQERLDAYTLGRLLIEEKQPHLLLWNRIKKKFWGDGSALDLAEKDLAQYGLECCKTRIREFNKASEDADIRCFVRNTLCWPDRYVEMACPELVTLFEEIVSFLG